MDELEFKIKIPRDEYEWFLTIMALYFEYAIPSIKNQFSEQSKLDE